MNGCRSDVRVWCYFHPRELVVGICALCLNERLLLLASKHKTSPTNKPPNLLFTKILALTTLLNRLEIKHNKPPHDHTSSTTPEDSFISIKFEENGVASWEKEKTTTMSHRQPHGMSWNDASNLSKDKIIKCLVEHGKPRATLRWRKRVGHLFQLIRWKRSNTKQRRSKGFKMW